MNKKKKYFRFKKIIENCFKDENSLKTMVIINCFKDDKKDGEYILYNPDGTVKFRAIYKDDIEQ